MMRGADVQIVWDLADDPDGNARHILEGHDVSLEEVEQVLRRYSHQYVVSRKSGYRITYGQTDTGREIAVVWECVGEHPLVVYPITAWPTE